MNMISPILIIANTIIFLVLSLLHVYWAFGGNWAIQYTIPEKFKAGFFDPNNRLKISFATIVVAIGLFLFALITLSNYVIVQSILSNYWIAVLTLIIGIIFSLRAIGDFNVVGLFKKDLTGDFAKKDSQIFVPLCIYLGLSSFVIYFL